MAPKQDPEPGATPAPTRTELIDRVASAWAGAARAELAPLGITAPQFRLLAAVDALGRLGSGARQSDVAERALMDPVTASETLRTLERRLLISREPHPTDRRARAIRLTEAGAALHAHAHDALLKAETAFFELGMAEFGPLAKALKRGGRGQR